MPTISLEAVISCVIFVLEKPQIQETTMAQVPYDKLLLTKLAQAILRNIAPWSFLYGPRCAPSLVPQCSTNTPQYGPPAQLVRV